ncbi:radical SAM protein [Fusibacter sp. JL298sf-3]
MFNKLNFSLKGFNMDLCNISAPLFVDVSITNKCDLNCLYCYACAEISKNEFLPIAEVKKLFDQLEKMGVHYIRIAGGEPLLHPDIKAIIELISNYSFLCSISTNAISLNEELVSLIKRSNIDWVVVSLDGPTEAINNMTRGGYSLVMDGIKLLVKHGVKTRIASVLTSKNYMEIKKMVELSLELNVQGIGFLLFSLVGRASMNQEKIELDLSAQMTAIRTINECKKKSKIPINVVFPHESHIPWELESALIREDIEEFWGKSTLSFTERVIGCKAGVTTCSIASNGDVYGCEQLMNFEELKAGNIRENKFSEIWENSSIFKKIRDMKISDLSEDCVSCNMKGCGGGCRAIAYTQTNNLYGKDSRCEILGANK